MSKVNRLEQMANFVFYVTLQFTVAQFITFERTALCFIYVAFFLLLPRRQAGLSLLLFTGFLVGLLVDMFYNSGGIHAFSSVLIIYSRARLLQYMLPTSGYDVVIQPTLGNLGWKRFTIFSLLLIGIHHVALFFLETTHSVLFFLVIRKVVLSTLLTYTAILFTQSMLFLVRRR